MIISLPQWIGKQNRLKHDLADIEITQQTDPIYLFTPKRWSYLRGLWAEEGTIVSSLIIDHYENLLSPVPINVLYGAYGAPEAPPLPPTTAMKIRLENTTVGTSLWIATLAIK